MAGDLGADEAVRIVPYDASWPARFESEKELLEPAIAAWVTGGVHHVGSTAIPGLAAKPVIDILVGVEGLPSSRECFGKLAELGYRYAPYRVEQMHWFCKPNPMRRTHHLHLVPTGSRRYCDELAFRDALRARSDLAERYEALKRMLAAQHRHDREAYTDGKEDFIAEVLSLYAREADVRDVVGRVAELARSRSDVRGAALVGSWARDRAGIESDVDFIVLTNDVERYTQNTDWSACVYDVTMVVRREHWGVVSAVRLRMQSGLELDFGFASPSWASIDPLDPGTHRVVREGLRVLADPDGLLTTLRAAAGAA